MKKLVYLISPNKIDHNFFASLDKVLSFKNVKFFQLRLKNLSQKKLLNFSKRIIKITTKHKVKFIINDNFILASKINADGCHMGQSDGSFSKARKKLKNKIFGITCHNSKKLANNAIKNNVSYLAFGSFFKSKLKPQAKKANLDILKWAKNEIKKPIVVIGGIKKNVLSNSKDQVPAIGNMPVIGNLFKGTENSDNLDELLVFIAPRIL